MHNSDFKSLSELKLAYANGQRVFDGWDFEEDGSVQGIDLSGIIFKNCFLFLDFKDANLTNAQFISCNMKTADFRGANLENGLIKNCLVESVMFKGAKVENFRFEENYCYGATVGAKDFNDFFIHTDEG